VTAVRIDEYQVAVPEAALDDLRVRLRATRFATELAGNGWEQGTPRSYLEPLVRYWESEYDWRRYEDRINSLPHFRAVFEGQPIHLFHVRSPQPDALALLLIHDHGHWGGEFLDVIGPLSDPPAHAGPAADGFHVVVASLPGFAFSGPGEDRGWGPRRSAKAFGALMDALGYQRWVVAGHGLGGLVGANLADLRPEQVVGLHLHYVPEMRSREAFEGRQLPDGLSWDSLSPAEQAGMDADAEWRRRHVASRQTFSQLPQSIGVMLENSPAGLAAWTSDLWRLSSDGDIEEVFGPDRILDAVTTTWLTESATSAARMFYELAQQPRENIPFHRVEVPTAVQVFPKDFCHTPRRWVERGYRVTRWTEEERGGHFAALESPERLVDDLRRFCRDLR
jgi:pimeloyl-ACP methyl ester carboxylesterase